MTILFDGAGLHMFTTDSKSIGIAQVEMGKSGKGRCILPTAFCEQLLRLGGEGTILEIRDDCAIASTKAGVLVYARLVHAEQPRDFFEIMAREGVDDPEKVEGLFEIPGRLSLALERAIVLLDGAADGQFEIKIADGKMLIQASASGRGDLKDDSVDVPDDLPEISCSIDPELIKRAIPICTHMAFGSCLYMDDGAGFSYLAAYRGR
ncbi:MAG: hypothetical protein KGR26_11245 [Cyanobacteria bacterium REEB65]|nr:hypothetical protein [Cyanobacteria bacterium REEB65]